MFTDSLKALTPALVERRSCLFSSLGLELLAVVVIVVLPFPCLSVNVIDI